MSIKISVIANCQAAPVATLLRFLSPQIEINPIPAVHTIRNDEGQRKLLDAVEASDIIVHQPIGENFGPIATDT